ncbi:MAG: hypothetical protein ACYTG7_17260 [Planctomycetota bacterium]
MREQEHGLVSIRLVQKRFGPNGLDAILRVPVKHLAQHPPGIGGAVVEGSALNS